MDELRKKKREAHKRKSATKESARRVSHDLYEKGSRLYENKRYGDAADLFLRVLDLDPSDMDAMIALAACHISMCHFTEAAKTLNYAADIDPDDHLIRYDLGYALACMGRISEARQELRRCLKPNVPRDIKEAAEKLSSILDKLKSDEAISLEKEAMCRDLFLEAQQLLYSQRYREAIQIYEQILKIKPNHAASIANIGACYERMGDLGKALEYFRRAHQLEEGDPLILMNMGRIFHLQGYDQKAEDYIQKGLKQVSPFTPPRDIFRIAAILIEVGRYILGETFIKDQLREFKGNVQLTFLLGVLLAKQGKLSDAQEVWREIKGECERARVYIERAIKVMRGEMTLDEADFRTMVVTETMEVL